MSSLSRPSVLLFAAGVVLTLAASAGCDAPSTAAAAPPAPPTVSAEPSPSSTPDEGNGSAPPAQPKPAGTSTKSAPPPSWPTPEDCVSYNPANLTVAYDAEVFTVSDGNTVVARVHGGPGSNTGDKALAVAQRYKKHCFIGRDNTREPYEKYEYSFDYWRSLSGMNTTIPDQEEDCSPYDRNNLTVEDMGNGYGWRVKDHDHVLHLFDNETDARNGKLVLAKYSQICSVGFSDDGRDVMSYSL